MASGDASQVQQEKQQESCRPSSPKLCINNCGFYGTSENNNLCSCCFKKLSSPLHARSSIAKEPPASAHLDAVCASIAQVTLSPRSSPDTSSSVPIGVPASALVNDLSSSISGLSLSSPPSSTCLPPIASPSITTDTPASGLLNDGSPPLARVGPSFPSSTDRSSLTCSPQKPTRCFSCRKRVGLTGFKCRCGDVFCSTHRYADEHNCSFDYKARAKEVIAAQNPVVQADKVAKI